ncbi:hypothetical protein B0H19DRAFT_1248315 [Mycena capillaripes]|nr:hypothetical protein B0H19DRAFT_1248315 [Mycena capillaripes]
MALAQSPYIHNVHRRHPSAPGPIVHVQPTRTPGLLSLSKPPRAPKTDHKASPRPKPAQATARSPKPVHAEAAQQAPPQQRPEARGRQHPQGKRTHQPQQRSASHAAPTRRRQPSPDPFRAAPPQQPTAAPPPPTANKRRSPPPASAPIPVPPLPANVNNSNNNNVLSRSDPVASHMPLAARRKPIRTQTLDSWDQFPVCDDTADDDLLERPTTPTPRSPVRPKPTLHLSEPRTPTRRSRLPEPPRTAPLSSVSPGAFPFPVHNTSPTPNNNGPSPHASPKRRADRRAKHLSEGVVMPPLFPFVFDSPSGEPRRSRSSERSDGNGNGTTTLFASSMFQNSPSPEELPPPLFA